MRTYQFRLYPNKEEERKLSRVISICCLAYNRLLEEYNSGLINYNEMGRFLTQLKKEWPELNEVYSKCLQPVRDRLFINIKSQKAMRKRGKKIGKPRFKSESRFRSFTYNQSGYKLIPKTEKFGLLYLSKVGYIPVRLHREVEGIIKQVIIKHFPSGKWYVYVIVDDGAVPLEPSKTGRAVGLDVGIESIVVDSDGNEVENPRFLNQALKKLRRDQKQLRRKKKGSTNWEKQRIKVARQYEHISNQRNDFHHKLSRHFIDNYELIVTEELQSSDMVKDHKLTRSIYDASWNGLNQNLAYKAENAGKLFVQVDPKGTSQECSSCGKLVPKTLRERWHDCPQCGLHLSRDYNASINILKRGVEKVGQELPEHACGHWTATSLSMEVQARWMRQEAPAEG